jgi:hypothetical protein
VPTRAVAHHVPHMGRHWREKLLHIPPTPACTRRPSIPHVLAINSWTKRPASPPAAAPHLRVTTR